MKKLTYEFVENEFRKRGYTLLETEYINNNTKMRFQCPKHPDKEMHIKYSNFSQGQGCKYCGYRKTSIIFDEVKLEFEKRGYVLLTKEYINTLQSLEFICPLHPDKIQTLTYTTLRRGCTCKDCAWERLSELKRHPFEFVKQSFEDCGYKLLETEYINSKQKLRYICPNHPDKELYLTYNDIYTGTRCKYCVIDSRSGEKSNLWRGGTSSLGDFLRGQIYSWKLNSFKENEFKCFITGEYNEDLEIHHTYPFHLLRDQMLEELNLKVHVKLSDYSALEKELMKNKLLEIHNDIKGIPLRREIHKLFHRVYGDINVSYEYVLEFKSKIESGEIDISKLI